MSARQFLILLLLAAPLAGHSAEPAANIAGVAKALREGRIDIGKEYSVDPAAGRYHRVHVTVLGLGCSSCHHGEDYRSDYLLVGKGKPRVKSSPGRYDRTGCLGCHRAGGNGTAFYGKHE